MPSSLYRLGRQGGQPDFFLATSSAGGKPCANYVMSLCESTAYLTSQGIAFDYWLHSEDCHVDDARNFLVQMFLESGAPFMVFIDDDVGWDGESLARLILRKDADIVGGAYPLKQGTEDYPIRIFKDRPTLQAREDGLLEVEGVPTGFMRISREVIEAVRDKRKHMTFVPKEGKDGDSRLTVVFERMMVDGKRWSGDLNFCREARGLGFKVWVDPEMRFTHQGNNLWEGHLGNWLRKRGSILDSRLDLAIDKLISGDNSMENFVDIWRYYANPFAMSAAGMKEVYDRALEAKGPILEVGSGITTIIAGIACQRTGQMVHALEHDIEWFGAVRNFIQLWKVKAIALYYAPLQEYPIVDEHHKGRNIFWYEIDESLPQRFSLAILDGPPRRYGREGVFKLVMDRIKRATWVVDDTDDPGVLAMLNKYAEEHGKIVKDIGPKQRGKRHHAIVQDVELAVVPEVAVVPAAALEGGDVEDDSVFSAA